MSDSVEAIPPRTWNWEANRARLYGWLTGLLIMFFGGLICSVPIGVYLGIPVVALGLFLAITFAVSMSGAPVRTPAALVLFLFGLILSALGRAAAPVAVIVSSFREARSVVRRPEMIDVMGLPLFLLGIGLVGIAAQWLRPDPSAGRVRRGLGLLLIHGGSLVLMAGALSETASRQLKDQPTWAWLAVPIMLGAGVAFRVGGRGRLWLVVTLLSAAALPLAWQLLILRAS